MFIKFDDLELLEFFGNNPILVGDADEGNFIYSLRDDCELSMVVTIDTYAKKIDISVCYSGNTIFSGQFDNVTEIKKSEDVLLVETEQKKRLVLKKTPCVGVFIENFME